ncbi:phospholipase D family protein, partial [Salmonella enterica subsp. enterica]|nr:phospholipase D family protein [Salmonella enterica subsp. enterica]
SQSANSANSENAILIQDVPELAKQYLQHWQSRWQLGHDWKSTY